MEKSRLAVAYSHFFLQFSSRCTFAKLAKYELSKVLVLGSSHFGNTYLSDNKMDNT